jgi:hypothetical protein
MWADLGVVGRIQSMDDSELQARIEAIAHAMKNNALTAASELADETERALTSQPDPELYGWLCFYRFRAAFLLEEWERAWSALPPRFMFRVSPTNAAWMFSARAEVAARTGRVEELLAHASRCIGIRRETGDVEGMLEAAMTACELLHEIERDDLNTHFLPVILGEARFLGQARYTAYGYVTLVRNIIATGNPICIDVLLDGREWLARCDDECAEVALDFARTSKVVLERVASRATARLRAVAPPPAVTEGWAPDPN